ncbi:hypothetical protein NQ317_011028 [Molorchus minor]|uniref:Reverse transcriptase zinc-binding domain-containing protein n=1 Tax=Molorchus minor TaxID=1323400 RepID=A0ABQ9JA73_9CUCU|nr:hypothetical protein NQ317_011028 [Molorchus minor]
MLERYVPLFVVVTCHFRDGKKIIALKYNFAVSENPVICRNCADLAWRAFTFKSRCISTEDIILSYADAKGVTSLDMKWIYHTEMACEVGRNINVCRFCMTCIGEGDYLCLENIKLPEKWLEQFLPEVTTIELPCCGCQDTPKFKATKKADELARKGSSTPFIGPVPALGVSKNTARGQTKEWIRNQHGIHWNRITSIRHGRMFIKETSQEKTKELLLMSRKQIKVVVGLLTGHCALKGHLHRMGLYNGDLKCRLCNRETETAQHVLCYCETLDCKRQEKYGQPKLSPEVYITQPTGKLYKLVKGTQLLEWVT